MNYVISICGPESLNTLTSICRDLKASSKRHTAGGGNRVPRYAGYLGNREQRKESSHHSCKRKKDKKIHPETEATDVHRHTRKRCGHSCSHKEYRRRKNREIS